MVEPDNVFVAAADIGDGGPNSVFIHLVSKYFHNNTGMCNRSIDIESTQYYCSFIPSSLNQFTNALRVA